MVNNMVSELWKLNLNSVKATQMISSIESERFLNQSVTVPWRVSDRTVLRAGGTA